MEIFFPEISADGVMSLLCENFDLKWIIFGGEFIVLKKIRRNEERFIEWEKKHGKVDWIQEDKEGTYEDVEVKEAKRELKKLEDMDLPAPQQEHGEDLHPRGLVQAQRGAPEDAEARRALPADLRKREQEPGAGGREDQEAQARAPLHVHGARERDRGLGHPEQGPGHPPRGTPRGRRAAPEDPEHARSSGSSGRRRTSRRPSTSSAAWPASRSRPTCPRSST